MQKDFDGWNEQKKKTDANEKYLPLYYVREVRWCRLGVIIGFEQDGSGGGYSRPVVILKGLVLPLTTSMKKNKYHFALGKIGDADASAIISQLRLIDTRRLDQHIGVVNKETFTCMRKAVKDML
ncbi:type II toxin-antitoxin system PemK/MazF family toxin [Candidatus Kaiserbacteria bacterium]|nr:type II toxin-antitoxin system PemK/MazF family toxin [Candidatus Kaiserbacteria bacterium]